MISGFQALRQTRAPKRAFESAIEESLYFSNGSQIHCAIHGPMQDANGIMASHTTSGSTGHLLSWMRVQTCHRSPGLA
ncbi:hypothetical protein PoB_007553300 [Plakobranchus ocellatus]|uniref:Uncharacterized protein n=1 Tax=Plakobranchus ocellatus TaxID=259542 RepID=A0AAV4DY60_9GAST|nr:hypothetical protein PoB_007553300 [Plakobranchus ocellatus]